VHTDAVHQSQFVLPYDSTTPLLSRLSFHVGEPFAVSVAFRTEWGRWIEWTFARDLLVTGLTEPSGIGDVRVRPDLSEDETLLILEIESPDGYAARMPRTEPSNTRSLARCWSTQHAENVRASLANSMTPPARSSPPPSSSSIASSNPETSSPMRKLSPKPPNGSMNAFRKFVPYRNFSILRFWMKPV